jgi:hypothetical protein
VILKLLLLLLLLLPLCGGAFGSEGTFLKLSELEAAVPRKLKLRWRDGICSTMGKPVAEVVVDQTTRLEAFVVV